MSLFRRQYRLFFWLLAGGVLILALGYGLLPWYLPAAWVKTKIVTSLERQFAREVTMGNLSLSWRDGIVVSDLTVARRPGFGEGNLLAVEQLQLPFAPLELLRSRINHLLISRAKLYIIVNHTGRINIDDLHLQDDFVVSNILINQSLIHIIICDPSPNRSRSFAVESASIYRNPEQNILQWSLQARQIAGTEVSNSQSDRPFDSSAATITSTGRLSFAGTVETETEPLQSAQLSIDQFDLGLLDLPALLNRRLARGPDANQPIVVDQLRGKCSLELRMDIAASHKLNFTGRWQVAGADITTRPVDPNLDNRSLLRDFSAAADFAVEYDPATGIGDLSDFNLTGPGLTLKAAGYYNPRPGADKALAVKIDKAGINLHLLSGAVPILRKLKLIRQSDLACQGWLNWGGDFTADERAAVFSFNLDAASCRLDTQVLAKRPGEPARLDLLGRFDRDTGDLSLEQFRGCWSLLDFQARLSVPDSYQLLNRLTDPGEQVSLIDVFALLTDPHLPFGLDAKLDINDLAGLEERTPCLRQFLSDWDIAGPAHARLKLGEFGDRRKLEGQLLLPPNTVCNWRDRRQKEKLFFSKSPSRGLNISLAAALGDSPLSFEQLQFTADMGGVLLTAGPGRFALDPNGAVSLQTPWKVYDFSELLTALPTLSNTLQRQKIALTGSCQGDLALRRDGPPRRKIEYHGSITLGSFTASAEGEFSPRLVPESSGGTFLPGRCRLNLQTQKLEDLHTYLPALFSPQGRILVHDIAIDNLGGSADLQVAASFDEPAGHLSLVLDAGGSSFIIQPYKTIAGASSPAVLPYWDKHQGAPCRLSAALSATLADSLAGQSIFSAPPRLPLSINIEHLEAVLTGLTTRISGNLYLDANAVPDPSTPWMKICPRGQLSLQAALTPPASAAAEFPLWEQIYHRCRLDGTANLSSNLDWDLPRERYNFRTEVDLSRTALQIYLPVPSADQGPPSPPVFFAKPLNDRLVASCSFSEEGDAPLRLQQFRLDLPDDSFITVGGTLQQPRLMEFFQGRATWPCRSAELDLNYHLPRLSAWACWFTPLASAQFAGHTRGSLNTFLQFSPTVALYLKPSTAQFTLSGRLHDMPIGIEANEVEFSSSRLYLPDLKLGIGNNQLHIVADVHDPFYSFDSSDASPSGRVDLLADTIDADTLTSWLLSFDRQNSSLSPPSSSLAESPAESPDQALIGKLLPLLRRCRLRGCADIAAVNYTDPDTTAYLPLRRIHVNYQLLEQQLQADFLAALCGGVVEVQLEGDLAPADPVLHCQYTLQDLAAGQSLRPLVESEFPDMLVEGTISQHCRQEAVVSCLLARTCAWAGSGVTVCTDGRLFGPGGPGWLVTVFPGLKLVEYPWKRMTNQFEKLPDGGKKNHMLFHGQTYDIYLDGLTQPVTDPNQYEQAIQCLDQDLQLAQQQLRQFDSGQLELGPQIADRLQRRVKGLDYLWQRRQAGEVLSVGFADYVVGGILSLKARQKFATPRELLRIPFFQAQGYIIGRHMVGLATTNVPLIH